MITQTETAMIALQQNTITHLHKLHISIHRVGYKQLQFLVPLYALDSDQSLTKELYPYAAKHFGYISWQPVEHAIRSAILDAWKRRNPDVWEIYFPGTKKAPSNKQFIATLAELIKNTPPD